MENLLVVVVKDGLVDEVIGIVEAKSYEDDAIDAITKYIKSH